MVKKFLFVSILDNRFRAYTKVTWKALEGTIGGCKLMYKHAEFVTYGCKTLSALIYGSKSIEKYR